MALTLEEMRIRKMNVIKIISILSVIFIFFTWSYFYSSETVPTSPAKNTLDITRSYANRNQIKNELIKWVNRQEFKADLNSRSNEQNILDKLHNTKFDVIVYNRVAKCGSTTTKLMLEALSTVLNYTFIEHFNKTGTKGC